jgi:hypothetical protein
MLLQICDNKRITPYKGDIQSFKMDMRNQMGIEGHQKSHLRGDASVTVKQNAKQIEKSTENIISSTKDSGEILPSAEEKNNYIPPHIRKQDVQTSTVGGKYIPPHLRNRQD